MWQQAHEILQRIVPLLALFDLVRDLQIFQRSALLTPPSVPLQHPPHETPIKLACELNRFNFFSILRLSPISPPALDPQGASYIPAAAT
jgi:hypothetical protein